MPIDTTITISVIVALVALISPIITAIINNRHQLKIKMMEYKENRYTEEIRHQKQLLEHYCNALTKLIIYEIPANEHFNEYGAAFGEAVLYMNKDQSKIAVKLYNLIAFDKQKCNTDVLNNHILQIKDHLKKLDKQQQ